jgi:UDP-3-O-acyl-N-acetylglucosamine deacetylase
MVKKTIKTEISLTGVGLHTGKEVKMTFKPAPINNGFTLSEYLEDSVVEADANFVYIHKEEPIRKTCVKSKPQNMFWRH